MSTTQQKEIIDITDEFKSIAKKPYKRLTKLKQRTPKKMIGCITMHVPEELVHAAGFLPVTPIGPRGKTPLADGHIQHQVCPPVRNIMELHLRGDLDFLDGFIFIDICDGVKSLVDLWNYIHPIPLFYNCRVPRTFIPAASGRYLYEEFGRLKSFLEQASGQPISNESLKQSIILYNQDRKLLKDLYRLRLNNPNALKAKDVMAIVAASNLMSKEEHIKLLTPLLKHLEDMKFQPDERPKIIISGSPCWDVPASVLDLIEEFASIPDDDCYIGYRSFADEVREDGDPIQALVDAYMKGVPCVTKQNPSNDLSDYLIDKVKKTKAKGIVVFTPKHCDSQGFTYIWLSDELSRSGVPSMLLELDQEEPPLASFRTRVEAFVEMIKE